MFLNNKNFKSDDHNNCSIAFIYFHQSKQRMDFYKKTF